VVSPATLYFPPLGRQQVDTRRESRSPGDSSAPGNTGDAESSSAFAYRLRFPPIPSRVTSFGYRRFGAHAHRDRDSFRGTEQPGRGARVSIWTEREVWTVFSWSSGPFDIGRAVPRHHSVSGTACQPKRIISSTAVQSAEVEATVGRRSAHEGFAATLHGRSRKTPASGRVFVRRSGKGPTSEIGGPNTATGYDRKTRPTKRFIALVAEEHEEDGRV